MRISSSVLSRGLSGSGSVMVVPLRCTAITVQPDLCLMPDSARVFPDSERGVFRWKMFSPSASSRVSSFLRKLKMALAPSDA
ncbi:MAG: hypothetical protein BWX71_02554 [Deltaproteobacteria bacterium ADurb.Bin072]|nr:MAG: hypothetical protein BWX71_02554 [Deltaproteobacteria bacterium ADurb.Bin072]